MIEFYDNDMSVCAQKVRLVLAEKDLTYNRVHLNLRAGDQFKPDYLKLNPKAVVPTIVHDGNVVIESTVIISYLEDVFGEPSLTPNTALHRAKMLQWMILPDAGLHDTCGLTSFALAFRKQLATLEPDKLEAHYAKMPDEKRRNHVRTLVEQGLNAPGVDAALRHYKRVINSMEQALESATWIAGETYSLADVTMLPYVLRLEHLGLSWFWSESPRIEKWLEASRQRSNYDAITDHLDPKYLGIMSAGGVENRQQIERVLDIS